MIGGLMYGLLRAVILVMLAHNVAGTYQTPWGVTFEITYDADGSHHKYCESSDVSRHEVVYTVEQNKYFAKYDIGSFNIGAVIFSETFNIEF